MIRTEQDKVVPPAELDEHRVDGSQLDTVATARISNFRSFDVVFAVRLQESDRGEPGDQLVARLRPVETLQQFLQHQPGREDLVGAFESVPEGLHFRCGRLGVAAKGERPNAGIDQKTHDGRVRSDL